MAKKNKSASRFNGKLSRRDYFASAALQGLLASSFHDSDYKMSDYALTAYMLADAMIKRGKKERERVNDS